MVPDGGIRACDRERTQDPDGKRSAAGGQRVADVQARVTEPVAGDCPHFQMQYRTLGKTASLSPTSRSAQWTLAASRQWPAV
jgi:hypothetical protein